MARIWRVDCNKSASDGDCNYKGREKKGGGGSCIFMHLLTTSHPFDYWSLRKLAQHADWGFLGGYGGWRSFLQEILRGEGILTYFNTYLPIYLPTYLPTYLSPIHPRRPGLVKGFPLFYYPGIGRVINKYI